MNQHILTNPEKCEACNRCVSICPVEANKVVVNKNNHLIIDIINERCIQCAECIHICKHDARYFTDDTDKFLSDVGKFEMAVIVAPAILHTFKNYKNLFGYLKSLGVNFIYDISFGADITT